MIEVRKELNKYLKTLHPRVYFQIAPETATFPYIIYDLPNSFSDGEGGEIITLDIDGWDYNEIGDTTTIETLMQTINVIDKKTLSTEDMAVTFFLENKIPLIDDDKRIKRRKYVYSGRLIRR